MSGSCKYSYETTRCFNDYLRYLGDIGQLDFSAGFEQMSA